MAKIVGLPDGNEAEFPDDMGDDAIAEVLKKQFPAKAPEAPGAARDYGSELKRNLGLTIRNGINMASSPATMGGAFLNKALGMKPPQKGLDQALDYIGLPKPNPDDWSENMASDMAKTAPASLLPGGLVGQVLGNAAVSGAMAEPGDEGKAMLTGGLVGAGGQVLSRALGGLIKPTPTARRLMNDGVDLTPGQTQGGFLAKAEDALASTPIIGAPMRDRMADSRASWEQATRAKALPPKANPAGADSVAGLQEELSKAYNNSLRGAKFTPGSNPVVQPDALIMLAKQKVPEATGAQMDRAKELVSNLMENGGKPHTPESLQAVEARLKASVSRYRYSANPEDKVYGDLLNEAAADMRSSWRNSLTNTKQGELAVIDSAYSKLVPIERASGTGKASLGGADGTELPGAFTPDSLLAAIRAGDKGRSKSRWFAGAAPLQGGATDAAEVIGSKSHSPNTVSRLAGIAGLAGSLAGVGPVATGAGLAAAGMYGTKPVQKVLTSKFATGGYEYQKALSDAIRRFSPSLATEANKE